MAATATVTLAENGYPAFSTQADRVLMSIDLSQYQPADAARDVIVDYTKLIAPGTAQKPIDLRVIMKASEGGWVDSAVRARSAKLLAADPNVPIGLYHFVDVAPPADEQLAAFESAFPGGKFNPRYLYALDLEGQDGNAKLERCGQISQLMLAKYGVQPVLYCGFDMARDNLDLIDRLMPGVKFWIGSYTRIYIGNVDPTLGARIAMWQFSNGTYNTIFNIEAGGQQLLYGIGGAQWWEGKGIARDPGFDLSICIQDADQFWGATQGAIAHE